MIGLLIIIIFPFIFFYTQMNKLNQKTSTIKKAIQEGKETYYDTTDGFLHWTENGEKVIHCAWTAKDTKKEITGDKILQGIKTGKVYRNYTKERFLHHVQSQMDIGKCWCYERHEYSREFRNDLALRYHMKDKYFYYLVKEEHKSSNYYDNRLYLYCKRNTGERRKITFEEYIQLGGSELTEVEYKKKNGYTVTILHRPIQKEEPTAFNYNDQYLGGK